LGRTLEAFPKWEEGKMTKDKNKKIKKEILSHLAYHSIPYQTRLLAAMDLERNHIKFSLYYPLVQYLPSAP